jgi:hypothetical protein
VVLSLRGAAKVRDAASADLASAKL